MLLSLSSLRFFRISLIPQLREGDGDITMCLKSHMHRPSGRPCLRSQSPFLPAHLLKHPILFDLDGTITDPKRGFLASMDFALSALGEPLRPHEELTPFIGPPLRGTFEILLGTSDTTRTEKAVSLYRERLNGGGKFEAEVCSGKEFEVMGVKGFGHQEVRGDSEESLEESVIDTPIAKGSYNTNSVFDSIESLVSIF